MMMNDELPIDWYPMVSGQRPSVSLKQRVVMLTGLVAGLAVLNYFAPAHPGAAVRVLASATIAACLYPSWRWVSGKDRGLPFAPLFGMVFLMYYPLALFLLERYMSPEGGSIPPSQTARSVALALLALLLILTAYYGSAGLLERIMPRPRMEWVNVGHIKLIGLLLSFVGVAVYGVASALHIGLEAQQFIVYLGDLSFIGIVVLFSLQITRRLDRLSKFALWFLVIPGRMLLGFAGGGTSSGLIIPLLLILTYSAIRRQLPLRWLMVGALSIFIIRPVMAPMRALTYEGGPLSGSSKVEKAEIFLGLMTKVAQGQFPLRTLVQMAATRLSDMVTFTAVVQQTPHVIPYWGGESYSPLLYKFVPRFLYPEKPQEESGGEFGHRYGFTPREDHVTSLNLPQTVELYANFGVFGIILGSLLFGVIYRMVHSIFVHPEMGFGALVAAIFLLSGMLAIESGTSGVFGGEMWDFVFVALISLLMEVGELRGRVPTLQSYTR
jgi:hypothetical protein